MSTDPIQLQPGSVVAGRYRVEGTLGQGGMAVVYRARHLGTDKECALKLLFPELADDPKLRELFLQEARVSGRIGACPYIVDVFDTGIDGQSGAPFIAMELLRGSTLGKRLRHRTIDHDDVPAILMQIAKGLEAAHKAGVVHRDLKPGNIFLTEDDEGRLRVKILDFGIAKVLEGPGGRTATQAGSPWYSAPEQLGASMRKLAAKQGFHIAVGVSSATDVWAFGLCACELVLGLRANRYWEADTSADLMIRIALEPRRPPSERLGLGARVVPGFDDWFLRCTAHDAGARYQSVLAAAQALVAILEAAEQAGVAPVAGPLPFAREEPHAGSAVDAGPSFAQAATAPLAAATWQAVHAAGTLGASASPGPALPVPGTHVSRIVGQGSSQALAGGGAEQALSAIDELRASAGASGVPTEGSGSSAARAYVAPSPSTPSSLGFSEAGVRGEVSSPYGAQTSSSWQHSAVHSAARKRVAILVTLGASFGLLLVVLFVVVARGTGSPVEPAAALPVDATSGESARPGADETAGAETRLPSAGTNELARQGATGASDLDGSTGGASPSAAPTAVPSASASAAASAGKARPPPRPEGKERVFEDF